MRPSRIEIIGAPSDLGANVRGAAMGPAALRLAGLKTKIESIKVAVLDRGDVPVPEFESIDTADKTRHYLRTITEVCSATRDMVDRCLTAGNLPLTLGGDHSVAIGSLFGVNSFYRRAGKPIGVIWFDAHADMNTPETSPSGNIHGMPLAVLLGRGHPELLKIGGNQVLSPTNVVLIGIRSVDESEKAFCRSSGIRLITMREVDEKGVKAVIQEAIQLASAGTAGIHVSFDLDVIDPIHAPGVSTAEDGGFTHREAHLALELIADSGHLRSLDWVELNPLNDVDHASSKLSVDLIQSALGKSVL